MNAQNHNFRLVSGKSLPRRVISDASSGLGMEVIWPVAKDAPDLSKARRVAERLDARGAVDDRAKRLFDFSLALALTIVLAPLFLLLALMVKLSSPGPAIFWQHRVGRNGELFPCLKLRTMVVDAQARLDHLLATDPQARAEWEQDQKLRDDPRITPIGQFLRRSSLDELPQLWNILMGHMSFVGPRPIVEDEMSRYGIHIGRYCAVRPGLTGLWQISGRNDVSYSERVRLDVKYVRRHTFVGDMFICARTVPAIIGSRGCY